MKQRRAVVQGPKIWLLEAELDRGRTGRPYSRRELSNEKLLLGPGRAVRPGPRTAYRQPAVLEMYSFRQPLDHPDRGTSRSILVRSRVMVIPPQKAGERSSFPPPLAMRTLRARGNCALAHGAPHDSRHELEPLTDAHAKRVPKPTLTKHVVGFSCSLQSHCVTRDDACL